MAPPLHRTSIVCRRCIRASQRASWQQVTHYSTTPSQADKTPPETDKADDAVAKNEKESPEKELGPLARRLEEATEEALFTGGRAGRQAVQDAGFSEELKEKLLDKIADAKFRTQYAGAFGQADLPESAGQGTRHISAAQPWTGQEPLADGVLRMLDDAKKPLAPGLRGKFQPPPVDMRLQKAPSKSSGQKVATARERASTYVGMGMKSKNGLSDEEREAYRKEFRERFEPGSRAMPNTIGGLAALANERIENAIARGQFKNIPRGPGVERDMRANNPFIDTTEYIMNKMIQRQDLVPPWIEKQQELSKATHVFRARLRNDWKRHVARMIASKGGSLQDQIRRAQQYALSEEVHNPSVRGESTKIDKTQQTSGTTTSKAEVGSEPNKPQETPESGPLPPPFRDSTWEQAEHSYLQLAVDELNRLTRSYNLMAPDLAKKGYFSLDRELRACFAQVAPEVAKEIQVRALGGGGQSEGMGDGGVMERLSGGKKVRIHVEGDEKAYGLKQWWRDVWKKE
ncbi:hypothetical protein B0T10DRAFT_573583 [Thelonectria olida]|uniref:DnaJ homologue subfamily C member 28 conserved domain-containing protein n=1 Tax=Thelonectria olida TaxID=1576542 RepID=A0A9P8W3J6_9HYPO|nr:hypothetical protein B0T10DRAFT_573583 [Thelonectria olida]